MKNPILTSVLIGCIAVMFSCAKKESVAQSTESPDEEMPLNTIPLDSGIHYIKMYQTYCKDRKLNSETSFRGAAIARTDLLGVLGIDPESCGKIMSSAFNRARAYVGYNHTTKNFHLLFTPIFEDGTLAGRDSILADSVGNRFVYDLTTPCPNTCDIQSPLYQAFTPY